MADINTIYAGVIDVQDPDVVIAELPGTFPWSDSKKVYLPDEVRAEIKKLNSDAVATVQAVKVAYTGSTTNERTAWIKDRITAIDNRVVFIKERTGKLLDRLKETGSTTYDTASKIFTTALSLVPFVGSAVSYISAQSQAAQGIESYKAQTLIQDYSNDLNQLAQIRSSLALELQATPTATTTNTLYSAATAIPTGYYIAGSVLLLLLIVWYRRRNQKRSKR